MLSVAALLLSTALFSPSRAATIKANLGTSSAMSKPCSERDRLKEVYNQATLEASVLSGALHSVPLGPEYVAALDDAEAAHLACVAARHAYESHCAEHGCEAEFQGTLWSAAS